jgi:hypothetical protein
MHSRKDSLRNKESPLWVLGKVIFIYSMRRQLFKTVKNHNGVAKIVF